jgi:predicted HAD superfamily Cof-like phosphohydrolase
VGMVGMAEAMHILLGELKELREAPPKGPDFVEAIDGIGDSLYVQFGAAIEFGIDMQPIFDEIHRANMAKVGGATRADGKTLKPEGWVAPRIAEKIAEQA